MTRVIKNFMGGGDGVFRTEFDQEGNKMKGKKKSELRNTMFYMLSEI